MKYLVAAETSDGRYYAQFVLERVGQLADVTSFDCCFVRDRNAATDLRGPYSARALMRRFQREQIDPVRQKRPWMRMVMIETDPADNADRWTFRLDGGEKAPDSAPPLMCRICLRPWIDCPHTIPEARR